MHKMETITTSFKSDRQHSGDLSCTNPLDIRDLPGDCPTFTYDFNSFLVLLVHHRRFQETNALAISPDPVVEETPTSLNMNTLTPLFRRHRISPKPKEQIPLSNINPSIHHTGFFHLPLEIRLEIYTYLFSDALLHSAEDKPEKYMLPFAHVSSGLIFTNRQLLSEVINYIYIFPRLVFPRPELCSLILTSCRALLNRLRSLEITLKAYETHLLDTLCDLIVQSQAPLTALTLHLVPTYMGYLTFPIPRYVILREQFRLRPLFEGGVRPWAPDCHHDHSFFGYHTNDFGDLDNTETSQSSLGRLSSLRHLTITGQPEFSPEFEAAVLKVHGGMRRVAMAEGKEVELGECCGVKNGGFYFEVWIP